VTLSSRRIGLARVPDLRGVVGLVPGIRAE
jgi:hypothetical protein